jgi:hypothetical protein
MEDPDYYHNISIIVTIPDARSNRESGLVLKERDHYVVSWDDSQISSPLDKKEIDELIELKRWAILV